MIRLARAAASAAVMLLCACMPAAPAVAATDDLWRLQLALVPTGGSEVTLFERHPTFATREACEDSRARLAARTAAAGGLMKTEDGRIWRVIATRCWLDAPFV